MTRLEAAIKWRERFPDRAAELRSVTRRYLGMGIGQDQRSEFARVALDVAEAELLGIVYGLAADPDPEGELPTPGGVTRAEAMKALDLEVPQKLSGRDRAAGVEHDD